MPGERVTITLSDGRQVGGRLSAATRDGWAQVVAGRTATLTIEDVPWPPPAPDEAPVYSERDARESEAERGAVLDALAGEAFWVFVLTAVDLASGDISMKVETGDGIDAGTLKSILRKALAALP